ncbi:hypothetical protein HCH_03559 [Hahella chejuensis KCTC 2396]|uniref:Uncharacterized protein n=1 Tax=Hahella chejuensis (strain KCTC 2396) TaxID=349521 RepID=Q2SGC3_HAHCH|nr:hypothetical protein [Hahella chejuensis]ABC30301.1 hypothetical protein HCH_03559 [Hahella chejuensis KCTC 2396]
MNEFTPFITQMVLLGVIPFAAYFLGVYIRITVFPSPQSLVMKHQFLVAIPLSVMVIAPLIVTLGQAITDAENLSAYLITIGVIIEHGLFMNEAVCERFNAKLQPA